MLPSEIRDAAHTGKKAELERLIKAGLDIDTRDQYEQTALQFAAHDGQVEAVKILIELGADISAVSANGSTALSLATERERTQVVRVLKDAFRRAGYGWSANGKDEVCRTREYWGRELTEVFDFAEKERVTFSKNLETGAESVCRDSFDSISSNTLHLAAVELCKGGGENYTGTVSKAKSSQKLTF